MLTVIDFYKNDKFWRKQRIWQEVMNGLPNEKAKNGLLVIRDFYKDGKFWRKWQIWEEYNRTGLNKIQMRYKKGYLDNYLFFEKGKFLPKMVN